MTPGTLMIFAGRNSIHRVSAVRGDVPRIVALLSYDTRPDADSSEVFKFVRYGRSTPLAGRRLSGARRVGDEHFVTQIGESFVGDGPHAAHLNTVLGGKGGAVETAWASALAHPTQGHTPFVAVLRPGLPVKPFTLFINKATLAGDRHAEMTWGPAQAGVAKGVAEAVGAGDHRAAARSTTCC